LISVVLRQFFINPNCGKWEKCGTKCEDRILIIPFKNFPNGQQEQKVKCKKQTVDIADNDDINRRPESVFVLTDPDHRRKKQKPGDCFCQANLLKPFDNSVIGISGKVFFDEVHWCKDTGFRSNGKSLLFIK